MWHNGNDSMRFIRPNLLDNTISVDIYLEVNSFLSVSAWFHGQAISTSLNSINDIRQVESILHEIDLYSKSVTDYSSTPYVLHCESWPVNDQTEVKIIRHFRPSSNLYRPYEILVKCALMSYF